MNTIDKNAADVDFSLKPSPEIDTRVREFLNAKLDAHGTDSQQVYITTVSNAAEPVVTFSQDLNALGNDTLEWGNVQIHDTAVTGCFSKHWVYDEAVRVSSPSVREVEALMQELLAHAKEHWNS